jgi:hypothetical protein
MGFGDAGCLSCVILMNKNIVLLRSGRHIHVAARSIRDLWPGCRLLVVSQPGTELVLDELGVLPEDRFIYSKKKVFSPVSFALSSACRRLRSRNFDEVAVLWGDPEGKGYSNVSRTALLLSISGFLAITPDGSVIRQETWHTLKKEFQRAAYSIAVFGFLQIFLYLPAAFLRLFVKR